MYEIFINNVISRFRIINDSQIVLVWYKSGKETMMTIDQLTQVEANLRMHNKPSRKIPWNCIQIRAAISQAKFGDDIRHTNFKEIVYGMDE